MQIARTANALLIAMAVACAIASMWVFSSLQSQREMVVALQAQLAGIERAANARIAEPAADAAAPPVAAPPAPPKVVAQTQAVVQKQKRSAEDEERTSRDAYLKSMHKQLTDPTTRRWMIARQRLQVERNYRDLARQLKLSPELADRFLNLLAEQELNYTEHTQWGMMEPPRDAQAFAARQRSDAEYNRQVTADRLAVLGADGMERWINYARSLPAREEIRALRTRLADSSTPLRDEQVDALIESIGPMQRGHSLERESNYNAIHSTFETNWQQDADYMEKRFATIEQFIERKRSAAALQLDREQMEIYGAKLDRDLQYAREDLKSWYVANEERRNGR